MAAKFTAPTHYPSDNDAGNYSVVAAAILTVLRNVGDRESFWSYPRDVMDDLLAIEIDGYKLFQLIDLGRQTVRAGLVAADDQKRISR